MTIAATAITINGDTAWLVVPLSGYHPNVATTYTHYNRPCDRCHGTGRMLEDDASRPTCPDCYGTGRHTFTIDVRCDLCEGHGAFMDVSPMKPCSSCRGAGVTTLTVHVVEVLPIYAEDVPDEQVPDGQSHIVYNEGVGEFDLLNWSDELGHWRCDGTIPLSADAAPGKYVVRMAVHT
jgi:hypothetical protein